MVSKYVTTRHVCSGGVLTVKTQNKDKYLFHVRFRIAIINKFSKKMKKKLWLKNMWLKLKGKEKDTLIST